MTLHCVNLFVLSLDESENSIIICLLPLVGLIDGTGNSTTPRYLLDITEDGNSEETVLFASINSIFQSSLLYLKAVVGLHKADESFSACPIN